MWFAVHELKGSLIRRKVSSTGFLYRTSKSSQHSAFGANTLLEEGDCGAALFKEGRRGFLREERARRQQERRRLAVPRSEQGRKKKASASGRLNSLQQPAVPSAADRFIEWHVPIRRATSFYAFLFSNSPPSSNAQIIVAVVSPGNVFESSSTRRYPPLQTTTRKLIRFLLDILSSRKQSSNRCCCRRFESVIFHFRKGENFREKARAKISE